MADIIQRLRSRQQELKETIRKAQTEFNEIDNALAKLEALLPGSVKTGIELRKPEDFAQYVLKTYGPRLSAHEIVQKMTANGWFGSGEHRKDYKLMHQRLSSQKDLFRKVGRGLFELIENPVAMEPKCGVTARTSIYTANGALRKPRNA